MPKKVKKYLKFLYRWLQPVVDPFAFIYAIPRYVDFVRDLRTYSHLPGAEKIKLLDTFPRIHEKTPFTNFDKHYFYQDSWAFKKIFESKAGEHVDVGSSVGFIGFLSAVAKVKFVDIRPIEVASQNIDPIKGDVLSMPFSDNSLYSVSCLSVAEHVGLGRYGDPLDPAGTRKACAELSRVLAPHGNLYFALPVGKPKVCFNAHRIHSPMQILGYFPGLRLVEFSAVDDKGNFIENADLDLLGNAEYSCGLFWFKKP